VSAPSIRVAPNIGHGPGLRAALAQLELRLQRGALTIAGPLGPNEALCEHYRKLGLREADPWTFRAATRIVVVPPRGLAKSVKQGWKDAGHELLDLTLPEVRRAQTSLQLLAAEGCRPVVAGLADDPEALAIAGDLKGFAIAGDADEAARLAFSPKFGVVAQPGFSPRRARMIAEALKQRHRDARVTFLDTTAPGMAERERCVEGLSRWADFVMVIGEGSDASARALIESAQRLGLPSALIHEPDQLEASGVSGCRRVLVTAGEYTPGFCVDALVSGVGVRP
ncbi:MAG: putative hydroxymethylbutenyl pyrophosphate reductase, partial [Akkermansiaceae bacterium]|nr:putative hydroxymethylbutenyl pyrophosphate reductase [Akkermansiaceae bacterium]